jgi:hypothetical protein
MPRSPVLDLSPLLGSWRLESLGLTFSGTGERVEPYGPHPDGHMVLEASGRIMFLFTRANRPAPTSDADRAALFNDMTAYTGLVRLDGPGRFITTVDLAWNPMLQGEQLRFFTLKGDRPDDPIGRTDASEPRRSVARCGSTSSLLKKSDGFEMSERKESSWGALRINRSVEV